MTGERYEVLGETAIVTGSSSGIGRGIVEAYAEDGLNVVVTARTAADVERVADAINERDDTGEALAVACDVTEREQVEDLLVETLDAFGGVDILVNNAGGGFRAPFEEISVNGWNAVLDANLKGVFNCSQIVGVHMLENGGGTLINVASIAGVQGEPYATPYGAAKAGIVNFTTTLAYEWGEKGVRVNCVAPGFIATAGLSEQLGIDADAIDREKVDRHIGLPEETADLVHFLSTRAASFIQGETFRAQGNPRIDSPFKF